MAIFYFWGVISSDKISIKITYIHIALGLFLVILTLASLFGVDPHNSFFGTLRDAISMWLLYDLTIFALLLAFLINKDKKIIIKILICSFVSNVLVSSLLYYVGIFPEYIKEGSTIGNSSYLGAYGLFNFIFGAGLIFYFKKIWKKILVVLGMLIIMFSPTFMNWDILAGKIKFAQALHKPLLFLGDAMGATLGIMIAVFIMIAVYLLASSKKTLKIIGGVLLITFVCGFFYTSNIFMTNGTALNKMYIESKGVNRFITWDIADQSIHDHLFLGTGFNNFSYVYQSYFNTQILTEASPETFYQAHNVVLEFATAGGILGLISYFGLLFALFFGLYKSVIEEDREYLFIKISLIGIIFGYFIQNLFVFDSPTTYMAFFLLIGLAVGFSKNIFEFNFPVKITSKFISQLIIIGAVVLMFFFVLMPWIEVGKWGDFTNSKDTNKLYAARQGLQETSVLGGVEDTSAVADKFLKVYWGKIDGINDAQRKFFVREIDSMNDMLLRDIDKQPNDYNSNTIASELYAIHMIASGNPDDNLWNKAKNHLDKSMAINDQNSQAYLSEAQLYLVKDDMVNTVLYTEKAINLAPINKDYYDYADKVLSIRPNADFKKFVDHMKKTYLDHPKFAD